VSEAYFASLLLTGGVCLGFAVHGLLLSRQSRSRRYTCLTLLALLEAAYCVTTYGYFRQLEPARALPWGRAICVFTPFITYVFADLVMDLTGRWQDRPRWFRRYQAMNLVFTCAFAAQVALDGWKGTALVLTGVVNTDLASRHRHQLEFAPLGQAWLAWVSFSFILFAVLLVRAYRTRRYLLSMVVGCVAYFAATIFDFGILTGRYDAYFVQHFGFFALVIGCWWVLAGQYELSLHDLENAVTRLEEQRRRLLISAPLVHQHKLEGIGALAAGVAHEINNPVQGIMNYAALLSRRLTDPAMREFAAEILSECKRVTDIVRALLSFARADEKQLGSASVRDAIDDVVRLLRASLKAEGIEVSVDAEADLPELHQGGARIKQVLMNLLTNARDALGSRSPRRAEEKRIHIAASTQLRGDEPWLVIELSDNGDGIEPGLLQRIFDPFFTTKPPGRGTGLGLALSQEFVTALGGRIECSTRRGEGTVFRVELPADPAAALATRPTDAEPHRRGDLEPRTADEPTG
jgi:signal transduction histidine kinase